LPWSFSARAGPYVWGGRGEAERERKRTKERSESDKSRKEWEKVRTGLGWDGLGTAGVSLVAVGGWAKGRAGGKGGNRPGMNTKEVDWVSQTQTMTYGV
jgi:hypothetical protein